MVDYVTEGDFPIYGSSDDRADDIAATVVHTIMSMVKPNHFYRDIPIGADDHLQRTELPAPSLRGHQRAPFSPEPARRTGWTPTAWSASMRSVKAKLDYNGFPSTSR